MSVQIIETPTHVLECEVTPGAPGHCLRTFTLRLLSGPPLTPEQWGRLKEGVVRALIAAGNQVLRVSALWECADE